jgi:hypothetical protein
MSRFGLRAIVLCTLTFLGVTVASRSAFALEDVTLITDFGFNGRTSSRCR